MIFIMSGQPYKYHTDAQRFRDEYMEALNLRASIDDMNHQAVKTFVATGQLPAVSQMKDTRTTTEILADTEKLKINLISDLAPIADAQFAQLIIQTIVKSPLNYDNGLLVFLSQRVDDIVKNLQQIYKYKIKGDANDAEQFVAFINKMYMDKNALSKSTKGFINRSGVVETFGGYSSNIQNINQSISACLSALKIIYHNIITTLEEVDSVVAVSPQLTNQIKSKLNEIYKKLYLYLEILPENESVFKQMDEWIIEHSLEDERSDMVDSLKLYLSFFNENLPKMDVINMFIQKIIIQEKLFLNLYEELFSRGEHAGDINRSVLTGINSILDKIFNILIPLSGSLASIPELQDIKKNYNKIFPPNEDVDQGVEEQKEEGPQQEFKEGHITELLNRPVQALPSPLLYPDSLYVNQPQIIQPSAQRAERPGRSQIPYAPQGGQPTAVVVGQPVAPTPMQTPIRENTGYDYDTMINDFYQLKMLYQQAKDIYDTDGATEPYLKIVQEYNQKFYRFEDLYKFQFSNQAPPPPRPQGRGVGCKIRGKGLQVDRTIGVKPAIKFAPFGKYLLDMSKLKDDTIAMKTMSGTSVVGHPSKKVSTQFSKIVKDMIGGKVPCDEDLSGLSTLEREYLHKVSKKANIEDKFAVATPSKDQYEKDIHSFEVMRGEIVAGNDNQEMIKKFKLLIMKLSRSGSLPKNEVSEILSELAELGY